MPRFAYKAVTPAGQVVEGEISAVTRSEVIEQLHAEGRILIRASQASEGLLARFAPAYLLRHGRLSPTDIVVITQEMATLLHAGVPIDRALGLIADLAEGSAKRDFINRVLENVRSGASFADALEQHKEALPSFYIGMLRAGEAAGNLDSVLQRLAEVLTRTQAVRESVRTAMYYPMIVLVVAALSIAILLTAVVPEFRPIFESAGATLPMSTKAILAVSDALQHFWWAMIAGAVGLIGALYYSYRTPAGRLRWDELILKLPLIGDAVAKLEVVRFTRTLGTLLASGVVALSALSIATKTLANRAVEQRIADIAGRLKKGEGLAVPLRSAKVFPSLAVQLIQVGEEAGQLDTMLLRVADIYDEEVKRTVQRLLSLLAPVVTIGLGLLVAAIIGSMLTAILGAYNLPLH